MSDTNSTPENLAATLVEVSQQLEDLRGSTLDPNDPLNEILRAGDGTRDATNSEDERAHARLSESGEPRTGKDYRISLITSRHSATDPDGTAHSITRAHDFDLPVSLSEVKAGWVVEDTAKVLDVFSLGLRTFAVYEML